MKPGNHQLDTPGFPKK